MRLQLWKTYTVITCVHIQNVGYEWSDDSHSITDFNPRLTNRYTSCLDQTIEVKQSLGLYLLQDTKVCNLLEAQDPILVETSVLPGSQSKRVVVCKQSSPLTS